MRVSSKTGVSKQLANHGRLFFYVLIITACNLIKVIRRYFEDIEPTHSGADNSYAGGTKLIINDISARLMYGPIRFTCAEFHGLSSAMILGGICP